MNNHFAFYITTRNVQQDLLLSLPPLAQSKTRDIWIIIPGIGTLRLTNTFVNTEGVE